MSGHSLAILLLTETQINVRSPTREAVTIKHNYPLHDDNAGYIWDSPEFLKQRAAYLQLVEEQINQLAEVDRWVVAVTADMEPFYNQHQSSFPVEALKMDHPGALDDGDLFEKVIEQFPELVEYLPSEGKMDDSSDDEEESPIELVRGQDRFVVVVDNEVVGYTTTEDQARELMWEIGQLKSRQHSGPVYARTRDNSLWLEGSYDFMIMTYTHVLHHLTYFSIPQMKVNSN